MAFLSEKYQKLRQELSGKNVTLVAVSKIRPPEDILEAYHAGQRDLGENYVQELLDKYEVLPKDIQWHFIGHLQSNKVKYIAPFIYLIHGVDSEKILKEINKQGAKINRRIPCLLQVHIAKEETKFGFDSTELESLMTRITRMNEVATEFNHVEIKGLMGMATFTEDNDMIRSEFAFLRSIYDKYPQFSILSMGMSADYRLAIEAGTNMVRIGSLVFGERF